MKQLLSILGLLAVISGCAQEATTFRLYGFNDDETAVAQQAMSEWCNATGGEFCPRVAGSDSAIVIRQTDMFALGKCDVLYRSAVDTPVVLITVRDVRNEDNWLSRLRTTLLHELGHAGGCKWHLDSGTIMADEEGDLADNITDADARCVVGN